MVPATAQFIYQAHDLDKPEMLGRLLQAEDADLMIVFTRTKRQAQRVADDLVERGFKASALHGDMAQAAREQALTKFREGKLQVLVATDVAARGIDVTGVTHVVNYSCPEDEKTYVHRIGRTGRAGATGIAITFVDWADLHRWKMINKALDLPFDDPQETYSSSENFLHDQGIDARHQGPHRPRGPIVVERKDTRGQGGRGDGGRGGSRGGGSRDGGNRNRGRSDGEPTTVVLDVGGHVVADVRERLATAPRATATAAVAVRAAASRPAATAEVEVDPRHGSAQAVTTTFVPTGAKSHRALASGSHWRMQPCD